MSEVEKLAQILRRALILLGFISCAISVAGMLGSGMDNSDVSPMNRSGLKLHTDNLTGCQYFSRDGALIQRVDRDGRHICTNDLGEK